MRPCLGYSHSTSCTLRASATNNKGLALHDDNRETLANASLLVRLIAMVNKVKLSFGHGIGLRYTDEPRSVYRTVYCWEFVAPAIG